MSVFAGAPDIKLRLGPNPLPRPLDDAITQLEIEESIDQPGTLLLQLRVNTTSTGDLQFVDDGTFEPMRNITLTVTPIEFGARDQCIFDGYVLSWRLHLDQGTTGSAIEIWAQDASWLMNVDDKIVEWSGLTDAQVANKIFAMYGFAPAPQSLDPNYDSPGHTPEGHTLFQRATDLQFLRALARRGGKLCRVACTNQPGVRTGYFMVPNVTGPPVTTIRPTDVDALDFDWDVMRPTKVKASQVDLRNSSGSGSDVGASSSGLRSLDARNYPAYVKRSSTLQLTAPADLDELGQRTAGVLRASGFFSRCTGEGDIGELKTILRVGDVVRIAGAGNLQSGDWLVWNVRHRILPDSWKMSFTLMRNAIGPPGTGGTLASLAGPGGALTL